MLLEIYEASISVVSVFYFFGGSTVKLCLYSARARNDRREKKEKTNHKIIFFI